MYEELFAKPNVNLVGYGYRTSRGERIGEGVVVGVRKKVPLAALAEHEVVPLTIYGMRTDVLEVGEIKALKARTEKWRPALGGISIGHYLCTAGTLGTAVKDAQTDAPLILSNCHVLAESGDAQLGDRIMQPGPIDGGGEDDVIGHLARYVPIEFSEQPGTCPIAEFAGAMATLVAGMMGSGHMLVPVKTSDAENKVDAAVASVENPDNLQFNIIDLGYPSGIKEVKLGDKIKKSGRTTETTEGEIIIVDAVVNVSYGSGKMATFTDQVVSNILSGGGDSGSLGLTFDGFAFGLLFAGGEGITIFNKILNVIDPLKVKI